MYEPRERQSGGATGKHVETEGPRLQTSTDAKTLRKKKINARVRAADVVATAAAAAALSPRRRAKADPPTTTTMCRRRRHLVQNRLPKRHFWRQNTRKRNPTQLSKTSQNQTNPSKDERNTKRTPRQTNCEQTKNLTKPSTTTQHQLKNKKKTTQKPA